MLTVDSVQSGAVYFATFELEHDVELSDFFIPPCEYMSSVAVDVWQKEDSDNPTRLGSTNDFSTKAFVLSNISPPPVCKFIKVSLGGKLGSGGALAKVNMGVFFGRPPLPSQYARDSLPVQTETLRLIRTEYQSHRSKLMALLQTIQHIDNGNIPNEAKLEIEQVSQLTLMIFSMLFKLLFEVLETIIIHYLTISGNPLVASSHFDKETWFMIHFI